MAREVGDIPVRLGIEASIGITLTAMNRPEEALEYLLPSLKGSVDLDLMDRMYGFAFTAEAYLHKGDLEKASQFSKQAIDVAKMYGENAESSSSYLQQEIWWRRFLVLRALSKKSPSPDLDEEIWQTINTSLHLVMVVIGNLSDNGLRRNYFNKIAINRQILRAWLEFASARNEPIDVLTNAVSSTGDFQEPFKRLIDIGVRLNERQNPDELAQAIISETIELTGADHAALFIRSGDQPLDATSLKAFELPEGADKADFLKKVKPILAEVSKLGTQKFLYQPEKAIPWEQRSIMCVPLVTAGKLVGAIYAELEGIYGRFTSQDLDLFKVLANQSAVAIKNANWSSTLEKKVQDRTAECSRKSDHRAAGC
jgi:tetratricopeptide (TPR) repeat protein